MQTRTITVAIAAVVLTAVAAKADNFGTGANQFTIDFVPISGSTNPDRGYGIVNHDYRMGTYEITNDQWDKFKAINGTVMGTPSSAYDQTSSFTGMNVPTNCVSWYEAAQFVNWLNTSTGHQAAYKFTGTQGTANYTFANWSTAEATGGTNFYRHKDAFYYLPTEDEWIKAAYWNGSILQTYATTPGVSLFQGNGSNGGWNYWDEDNGPDGPSEGPWNVRTGSQELNGTYDMMGNIWEWIESPYYSGDYGSDSEREMRGGSYLNSSDSPASSNRVIGNPDCEGWYVGFRVASVPEPATLSLIALGGFATLRRRTILQQ